MFDGLESATVLAICDPRPPNPVAVIVIGVVLLAFAAVVALLVRAAGKERRLVAITYLATGVLGAIIAMTPNGLSAHNTNYVARFLVGLAAGTSCGAAISLVRRRKPVIYAAVGLAGGGTFLAVLLLLFVAMLAASGACLD